MDIDFQKVTKSALFASDSVIEYNLNLINQILRKNGRRSYINNKIMMIII